MSTETVTPPESTGTATPPPSSGTPPPRRRGRPFGSRTRTPPLTETPVDPALNGGAIPPTSEPQPTRRRRRVNQVDTESLTKQLIGVHQIAAKMTGLQVIAIDKDEAQILANGIAAVAREYDLALDGKTGAFIQLLGAAALVYGPRVVIIQQMKQQARRQQGTTIDGEAQAVPSSNGAAAAN
jgi:hypothetical protein